MLSQHVGRYSLPSPSQYAPTLSATVLQCSVPVSMRGTSNGTSVCGDAPSKTHLLQLFAKLAMRSNMPRRFSLSFLSILEWFCPCCFLTGLLHPVVQTTLFQNNPTSNAVVSSRLETSPSPLPDLPTSSHSPPPRPSPH